MVNEEETPMKSVIVAIAALFSIMAMAFVPANAQTTIDTKGFGALTCNAFYAGLQSAPEAERAVIVFSAISWIQGHNSGKNTVLPAGERRDLDQLDHNYIADRLDSLCAINPSQYLYMVAEMLFEQMPLIKPTSNSLGV
jgi:hypothetical protein